MKFAVEHLGLAAHDPARLKDWYVATFDAKVVFDNGRVPPAFFIRAAGFLIEIYQGDFALKETGDNALQGWRHLALKVDSIEAAKTHLEGKGVVFSEGIKPAGGGGRVLFFRDPEFNLLHLLERTGDSAPLFA